MSELKFKTRKSTVSYLVLCQQDLYQSEKSFFGQLAVWKAAAEEVLQIQQTHQNTFKSFILHNGE